MPKHYWDSSLPINLLANSSCARVLSLARQTCVPAFIAHLRLRYVSLANDNSTLFSTIRGPAEKNLSWSTQVPHTIAVPEHRSDHIFIDIPPNIPRLPAPSLLPLVVAIVPSHSIVLLWTTTTTTTTTTTSNHRLQPPHYNRSDIHRRTEHPLSQSSYKSRVKKIYYH